MSKFEIKLDDLESRPVERSFEPSDEELEALFDTFSEDFEVLDDEPFQIEFHADLDGSTVLISGRVAGAFGYRCGKCLAERSVDVEAPMNFTVLSKAEWEETYEGEEEVSLNPEDLDTTWYEDESVDLRPLVRDTVMMELPAWPQCPEEFSEECEAGYQEHIGEETVEKLEKHSVDLRWWPLRDIELEDSDDEDESSEATGDQ